ncbi:hypothetical protein ABZ570_14765 [Micromonospora sp. NPDC007271]
MSGRRLGRLLGSLFLLAALFGAAAPASLDVDAGAQPVDIVWQ